VLVVFNKNGSLSINEIFFNFVDLFFNGDLAESTTFRFGEGQLLLALGESNDVKLCLF